jgi:hypothetical protein
LNKYYYIWDVIPLDINQFNIYFFNKILAFYDIDNHFNNYSKWTCYVICFICLWSLIFYENKVKVIIVITNIFRWVSFTLSSNELCNSYNCFLKKKIKREGMLHELLKKVLNFFFLHDFIHCIFCDFFMIGYLIKKWS